MWVLYITVGTPHLTSLSEQTDAVCIWKIPWNNVSKWNGVYWSVIISGIFDDIYLVLPLKDHRETWIWNVSDRELTHIVELLQPAMAKREPRCTLWAYIGGFWKCVYILEYRHFQAISVRLTIVNNWQWPRRASFAGEFMFTPDNLDMSQNNLRC